MSDERSGNDLFLLGMKLGYERALEVQATQQPSDPLARLLMPPEIKRRWLAGELKSKPPDILARSSKTQMLERNAKVRNLRYEKKLKVSEIARRVSRTPARIYQILRAFSTTVTPPPEPPLSVPGHVAHAGETGA